MPEAEVRTFIGDPIKTWDTTPSVDWYFGPSTLKLAGDGGMSDDSGFFDMQRSFTAVAADPTGQIRSVSGSYLGPGSKQFIGKSLASLGDRYGRPLAVRSDLSSRHLSFSGTSVSGSYYRRIVGIDAGGKVSKIIDSYHFD